MLSNGTYTLERCVKAATSKILVQSILKIKTLSLFHTFTTKLVFGLKDRSHMRRDPLLYQKYNIYYNKAPIDVD